MKQNEKKTFNCLLEVEKNDKGFIVLKITTATCDNVVVKVNDFGGQDKKTAKRLTYKLYKEVSNG